MTELASLRDPRAIALGNRAPTLYYVDKTGRNTDVDAASAPEDIWNGGGLYTGFNATNAETVTVVSSSAVDAAVGTGLRTITLIGQGAGGVLQTETVALNGTIPVTSTRTWLRLNRAQATTAGSGGVNAGAITIAQSVSTANVFAVVPAGFGQTQTACYSVYTEYTALVTDVQIACYNNTATPQEVTCALMTRESGTGAWRARATFVVSNTNPVRQTYIGGLRLPAGADVTVRALTATGDNLTVVARFELFLVKD